MARFAALLRGINVGGHNRVPMADLREACERLGWSEVETYVQSGNVVFAASGGPKALESALEKMIAEEFRCEIPAIVRAAADWPRYLAANPYRKAAEEAPDRVMMLLTKKELAAGAAEALRERATAGEQVEAAAGSLWIHYPGGVARSKLTPALIDRLAGSPATARNWRTVLALAEMLAG
jgi:uncharacterized protein (DUF1697 family)